MAPIAALALGDPLIMNIVFMVIFFSVLFSTIVANLVGSGRAKAIKARADSIKGLLHKKEDLSEVSPDSEKSD
jgi:Na+-driven multidrug efflux pump